MATRVKIVVLVLMMAVQAVVGSHCAAQTRYGVVFYNVENLFDTYNDISTADEDMLPKADRGWSEGRYQHKLQGVAQVIADLAEQSELPAVVALAEVENRKVLEDLVAQPQISSANYSICHFDSPDERGIDVAMLYRADIYSVEGYRAVRASVESAPHLLTRDYLLVWGVMGGERMLFCVVHFPSRIGGVKQTEHLRIGCAAQVREVVDSVVRADPQMRVVVIGDMNDNPRNRSLRRVMGATRAKGSLRNGELYNLTASVSGGSSVYDGRWNRFDNIIVSANLLGGNTNGLYVVTRSRGKRMRFVQPLENLLDNKGHPKPTYRGNDYVGGVSDHLPIYMMLER